MPSSRDRLAETDDLARWLEHARLERLRLVMRGTEPNLQSRAAAISGLSDLLAAALHRLTPAEGHGRSV